MFEIICGSAVVASAIIGLTAIVTSLNNENTKLSNEISYKTQENYALMRRHQEELEKASAIADQATRLKAIKVCLSTTKKSSDIAYANYKTMRNTLNTLYKQLDSIKKQKNNLKQTLENNEVDYNQKSEIIQNLKDISKVISQIYKSINTNKTKLDELHNNLKQLNDQVKNYNELKKGLINQLQQPYQTKQCKECGKTFTITNNEFKYYTNNNLYLPCRCYNCRQLRKAA